jgi:hypothetical protein
MEGLFDWPKLAIVFLRIHINSRRLPSKAIQKIMKFLAAISLIASSVFAQDTSSQISFQLATDGSTFISSPNADAYTVQSVAGAASANSAIFKAIQLDSPNTFQTYACAAFDSAKPLLKTELGKTNSVGACAKLASDKKLEFFGLTNYGMCYGGKLGADAVPLQPKNLCFYSCTSDASTSINLEKYQCGDAKSMSLYEISYSKISDINLPDGFTVGSTVSDTLAVDSIKLKQI